MHFCHLLIFFSKSTSSKSSFSDTIRVSSSLDQDQAQHFVGPDLCPNCLLRLSADDTSRQRINNIFCFQCESEHKEEKTWFNNWVNKNFVTDNEGRYTSGFSAQLKGPNFGPIPNRKKPPFFPQYHVWFSQLRKVKKKKKKIFFLFFLETTTTTYEKQWPISEWYWKACA